MLKRMYGGRHLDLMVRTGDLECMRKFWVLLKSTFNPLTHIVRFEAHDLGRHDGVEPTSRIVGVMRADSVPLTRDPGYSGGGSST